jgi:NADH-quinone oxidoreductase subunit N
VTAFDYLAILQLAAPETILVITALVVLVIDLSAMREQPIRFRLTIGAAFTSFGCLVALLWMLNIDTQGTILNGMLVVDPLTKVVKEIILLLTIFTALISIDANFTAHAGEFFMLLLLGAVGMLFLVSSEEILMIFVALELTSLSLYILTAFHKQNVQSTEAALKYFLFGGMSAAFTLFGLSLIYGMSGATNLGQIALHLKGQTAEPLFYVALIMSVTGFGFKVAAVPFHLWAPDTYQGAPLPSAAFVASGSKVASFFVFAKVMMLGFAGAEGSGAWGGFVAGWVPLLAVLAALSMFLGNLTAIVQKSVRRLLAYSAIAHAGYMLLALMADKANGMASLIYYAATYAITTIGAFGVVSVVQSSVGSDRFKDFAGLCRRAPVLSFCMMIFMLSLAGIPPLAGFFGKFYLFTAAVATKNLSLLWLVAFAIAMSAVSLYYYLQVLKEIYVSEPEKGAPVIQSYLSTRLTLGALALSVLIFGCAPNLILGRVVAAIKATGFGG